jgi:hypothetical protein
MNDNATFADMAVALTLASSKLELDLAKTKMIAERIGLSAMGYSLIVPSIERDVSLVQSAAELLREMCEFEDEVRALIERRKRQPIWPRLVKALSQSAATL